MLQQVPGRHEIAPAVGSVEALLLAHDHGELGIALVDERQRVLAGPLEGDALDVLPDLRVGKDRVHQRPVRALHGTEIDFDAFLLHRRDEVVHEVGQALGRPGAGGEVLGRVELILGHHHEDVDALLAIGLYVFLEIQCIRLEIGVVLDEGVLAFAHHVLHVEAVVLDEVVKLEAFAVGGRSKAEARKEGRLRGSSGRNRRHSGLRAGATLGPACRRALALRPRAARRRHHPAGHRPAGVILVDLHPIGRAPGGPPDLEPRILGQSILDQRDQGLFVVVD